MASKLQQAHYFTDKARAKLDWLRVSLRAKTGQEFDAVKLAVDESLSDLDQAVAFLEALDN